MKSCRHRRLRKDKFYIWKIAVALESKHKTMVNKDAMKYHCAFVVLLVILQDESSHQNCHVTKHAGFTGTLP